MKTEELKSKICFEGRDVGHNQTMITGKLEVRAVMKYDRRAIEFYQNGARALDEIKEQIREMIVRHIYDDGPSVEELEKAWRQLWDSMYCGIEPSFSPSAISVMKHCFIVGQEWGRTRAANAPDHEKPNPACSAVTGHRWRNVSADGNKKSMRPLWT
jgi:hypothetical protein